MKSYANRYAPCFTGNSLVLMGDGSKKLVKDIKKFDVVKNENG